MSYLARQADALYRQGNEFGDNPALINSISIWKKTIQLTTRDRPLDWAATQLGLGNALWKLRIWRRRWRSVKQRKKNQIETLAGGLAACCPMGILKSYGRKILKESSYKSISDIGGARGSRTPDLLNAIQALSTEL
jgi:hypothetical protein